MTGPFARLAAAHRAPRDLARADALRTLVERVHAIADALEDGTHPYTWGSDIARDLRAITSDKAVL